MWIVGLLALTGPWSIHLGELEKQQRQVTSTQQVLALFQGYKLGGGFKYIYIFYLYLGKWSNLTNIFQLGWNHHLVKVVDIIHPDLFELSKAQPQNAGDTVNFRSVPQTLDWILQWRMNESWIMIGQKDSCGIRGAPCYLGRSMCEADPICKLQLHSALQIDQDSKKQLLPVLFFCHLLPIPIHRTGIIHLLTKIHQM